MADLTLHTVQWCAQHGHPVLALRTTDDRYCIVAISIADAVALAESAAAAGNVVGRVGVQLAWPFAAPPIGLPDRRHGIEQFLEDNAVVAVGPAR